MSISDRKSSISFLILGKLDTIPASMLAFGSATLCSNSVAIRLNASKRVATSFGVAYMSIGNSRKLMYMPKRVVRYLSILDSR
jgi:hypothetical protein